MFTSANSPSATLILSRTRRDRDGVDVSPVLVVVQPIRSMITCRLSSGLPRELRLTNENRRSSICSTSMSPAGMADGDREPELAGELLQLDLHRRVRVELLPPPSAVMVRHVASG